MSDFAPGDLISVRFAGVLRHYGIVTYGGRVLSNNGRYGGVVSQSLDAFARGRPVQLHPPAEDGCAYLAHERTRRRLGNDYSLTGSNCVDFVRHARRERPTPLQYGRATLEAVRDMFSGPRRRW